MTRQEALINAFLVDVFNNVLHMEEASLAKNGCKNLSVSEMHVLETVQRGAGEETMSELAARLRVTASTLTVAVKTLEQKGYLVRQRASTDRRKVTVQLTQPALEALSQHAAFHEELVRQVCTELPPEELNALTQALERLHHFFAGL